MINKYIPDPNYRRGANMIAERHWINRFLTWSIAVESITFPGSRVTKLKGNCSTVLETRTHHIVFIRIMSIHLISLLL
jgi:hypothetical protein